MFSRCSWRRPDSIVVLVRLVVLHVWRCCGRSPPRVAPTIVVLDTGLRFNRLRYRRPEISFDYFRYHSDLGTSKQMASIRAGFPTAFVSLQGYL